MQAKYTAPQALLAAALSMSQMASAFYLPGVAPTSYKPDDQVPLYVNRISPVAAMQDYRLHSVVSYDYYHPSFQFCEPEGGPKYVSESLGSILFGDRIMTSPFDLRMLRNETCKPMCRASYPEQMRGFINDRIYQGYNLNWLVDGLPAGQKIQDELTGTTFYSPGFAIGDYAITDEDEEEDEKLTFNNHYEIWIEYHEVNGNANKLRVVGVVVQPSSKAYTGEPDCADNHEPIALLPRGQEPGRSIQLQCLLEEV